MRCAIAIMLAAIMLAGCASVEAEDLGLRLDRAQAIFAAVAAARRDVALSAFSLSPAQPIVLELEDDARRGVRVSVTLAGNAFGAAARANADVIPELRAAGVQVRISAYDTHLKAAIVDGVVYLSDVNFAERGLVVVDGISADRPIVAAAMAGTPAADDHLWTRKADAIAAEDRVAAVPVTRDLAIESESFEGNTALYGTIEQRLRRGDRVRVLVAAREAATRRERGALARLTREGAEVRVSSADEKLAVDGPDCYFGSANATGGEPDQIEWGMALRSPVLAAAVQARFDREWWQGSPWR